MSPGLKMKYTSQTGQNITYLDEGKTFTHVGIVQ